MKEREYTFKFSLFLEAINEFIDECGGQFYAAEKIGISQSSISRLAAGRRAPTIAEMIKICNETQLSPANFYRLQFN